jgi:hypothetical protein
MKKRLLAVILLSAVMATFSCGAEQKGSTDSGVTSDNLSSENSENTSELFAYPKYDIDLGGETFRILYFDAVEACGWSSDIPCDIDVAEQNGELLSDAVFIRNRKIEEMYNLEIEAVKALWDVYNVLERSVMAGSGEWDAVFPKYDGINASISNGYLAQLDGLFDFTNPWWDSKSLEGFGVLGKTYAIAGDLTFMDKFSYIIIMFNKNMAENYQLGDIYDMVVDRKWTFDKMLEMCQIVSDDLNNNSINDKDDIFGFSGQNDAAYELFQSAGEKFCTLDKDGIPYMSNDGERAISIMMKVYEFMNDKNNFFNRQTAGLTVADTVRMFTENRVLFLMRPLQTLMELRAMDADFGIIPTPLMDNSQTEYHTSIGHTVAIATCIPVDAKDTKISAAVLDTLAADSYFNMNDVLYDMILGAKISRDENSTENLDIIFDSCVYDPGCIFGFGGMANAFMKAGDPSTVASTVESYKSAVKADIDKFINILSEKK